MFVLRNQPTTWTWVRWILFCAFFFPRASPGLTTERVVETIDVLIDALNNFKGAVLIVSHDQYFLSKVSVVAIRVFGLQPLKIAVVQVVQEYWAVSATRVVKFHDLEEAKKHSYAA